MTTEQDRNKALVLEAFDVLFNKRDYAAAARYWSEDYIQHSTHIRPGRDGLFDLIQSLPETLRYENQAILADGDQVMLYGRFSGTGLPAAMITADVLRIQDGKLAEPLAERLYDLPHARLSIWLNAGVAPAQVAEWVGNSVPVLLLVYARRFTYSEQAAPGRIESCRTKAGG